MSANRKLYDIHVLCYEHLVPKYQTLFPSLSNIQFHDCFGTIHRITDRLEGILLMIAEKSTRKSVIFIDSLSMYMLSTLFNTVYRELLNITSPDKCNSIYYFTHQYYDI